MIKDEITKNVLMTSEFGGSSFEMKNKIRISIEFRWTLP